MSETLVGGKYRLERRLGGGGMADVFLAQVIGAEGFARTVVIKKMKPELSSDPEFVRMFLEEAQLVARLHHPNIAQVFDFGADPSGHYLVMEFLDGADARTLLRAARPRGGMPLAQVIAIATAAASGLHHAHELTDADGRPLGLVHRDVSPSNIMVTFDGAVKLIDFGIARIADRPTRTLAGQVKGTVTYMSPEQVTGGRLDRRSDLFSLGIAIYELVTAERPFERAGEAELQIMERIAGGAFKPASHIRPETPRELDKLLARLLAVDPADRPATAEELVGELEAMASKRNWMLAPRDIGRVAKQLLADAKHEALVPATLVEPSSDRASLDELLGGPRVTAPIGAATTLAPATRDLRTPAGAGAIQRDPAPAPVPVPTVPLAPTIDIRAQRTPPTVVPPADPRPPSPPRARHRTRNAVIALALAGAAIAIGIAAKHRDELPAGGGSGGLDVDGLRSDAPECLRTFFTLANTITPQTKVTYDRQILDRLVTTLDDCDDRARTFVSFGRARDLVTKLRSKVELREQRAGVRYTSGTDGDYTYEDLATGNRLTIVDVSARDN